MSGPCRYCGKPRPEGYITCGDSHCQEQHAGRRRNRNTIPPGRLEIEYPNGWRLTREKRGAAVIWETIQLDEKGEFPISERIEHGYKRDALKRLNEAGVL